MIVGHQLELQFVHRKMKVEQVAKKLMDTFKLFSMENKLIFDEKMR